MTRRQRRKVALCVTMALMVVGSAVYAASAAPHGPSVAYAASPLWTEAHLKRWHVGIAPLDQAVTLAERDYYTTQRDGTGLRYKALRMHLDGCSETEGSGGRVTRIHIYIRDRAWPHLPITDKALHPLYSCDDAWYPTALHGRDHGNMNVLIHVHVRLRDWPDKDYNFNHDVCFHEAC